MINTILVERKDWQRKHYSALVCVRIYNSSLKSFGYLFAYNIQNHYTFCQPFFYALNYTTNMTNKINKRKSLRTYQVWERNTKDINNA